MAGGNPILCLIHVAIVVCVTAEDASCDSRPYAAIEGQTPRPEAEVELIEVTETEAGSVQLLQLPARLRPRGSPEAPPAEGGEGNQSAISTQLLQDPGLPPGFPADFLPPGFLPPGFAPPTDPSAQLGTPIYHYAQNCWYACGRKPGPCAWCGSGNSCCRKGYPGCAKVKWYPVVHMATCVQTYGPPPEAEAKLEDNHTYKLYHATSPRVGPLILKEGFKPGHSGWCGGAIYFARSKEATKGKAIGPESHQGYMIEAMVNVRMLKRIPGRKCGYHNKEKLNAEGFDTVLFNPGDGEEVVIYDPTQVVSTKGYLWGR